MQLLKNTRILNLQLLKPNNMKKILLRIDDHAKALHNQSSYNKLAILSNLTTEFLYQFNDILNIELFAQNPFEYAISEIKRLNPASGVLGLSDSKLASLYEYDLKHLQELTSQFLANDTKLIFKDNSFVINDTIDFGIYTENKTEVDRFNSCMKLVEAINELRTQSNSQSHVNLENIFKWIDSDGISYSPAVAYVKQQ